MLKNILVPLAGILLFSSAALAALPPSHDDAGLPSTMTAQRSGLVAPSALAVEPGCGDVALDAAPHAAAVEVCTLGLEDEAWLAASLLVSRYGEDASSFAEERAARSITEQDSTGAELWQRISAIAAELVRRH